MALNIAGQTYVPASLVFSDGWVKYASGSLTFDATAIVAADYVQITPGFIPKYIRWHNVTDRICNEWYDGMAAESAINTLATGVQILSVTGTNKGFIVGNGLLTSSASGTIPGVGQFQVSQNATLGAILASKVIRWYALG